MARKRRGYNVDDLINKIKDGEKKNSYNNDDPAEYKPKLKEDGSCQVIMRFLPPHLEEDLPFVKIYSHGWKDRQGGWFIDPCPTTIGKPCPVCKENGRIWEEDEDTARPRSRKVSFWANILIIKDPNCPENEGKVFKYRYGKKIHEKIMEKINPSEPDIDPMVPIFDYEEGANFKLKIKKVGEWSNYDASTFAEPTPIGMGKQPFTDEELDELDGKLHKLSPIVDPKEFRSYEEMAIKFTKKTGIAVSTDPDVEGVVTRSNDDEDEYEQEAPQKRTRRAEKKQEPVKEAEESGIDDEDEDDEAFFNSLAQDD